MNRKELKAKQRAAVTECHDLSTDMDIYAAGLGTTQELLRKNIQQYDIEIKRVVLNMLQLQIAQMDIILECDNKLLPDNVVSIFSA